MLRKPIVVLGSPRSGTTLLSNLLKHHPDVYLAEEPRFVWKYGNDGKSDLMHVRDARPEVRSHIQKEFARQVAENGAERLVEKTPSNCLRVDFVNEVLPDCIFVHILRDGTESVLSICDYWRRYSTGIIPRKLVQRLKEVQLRQAPYYFREFTRRALGQFAPGMMGSPAWGPRLPGIDQMYRDMDLLEICALQWRTCVEMACRVGRSLPEGRYTECRLEELCEEELIQIMQFCELEPAEEVIDQYHRVFDSSQPTRRTVEASQEDIDRVRELIAPTTVWLERLEPHCLHRAALCG